ncbi:tubulin-specific chaperone E [Corynespora cassiicola Philippines]|uniref:Tubulin-specific chaperone E n=1 Tax=Corynespora cassiicola Philippines TaxID=1448308 RepID=A0A2T2P503_CORCC|nr:tubulin-specific chaperone E [Corynespora cassiicola Philippines]
MGTEFYVGKRLSYDGQLCTVRYIGEVKGTKGEWLGVEWDDPIRGKHSGEHGGVKYFECLNSHPTSGSFVRPTRRADSPRSFVEALKAKYAPEEYEDPQVRIVFVGNKNQSKDPLARLNQPIRISGKEVEEVGFDKIRKQLSELSELKILILDGLRMSRSIASLRERQKTGGSDLDVWPAGLTDIRDASSKATELDVSRNLFEEWREVASICEQLEKLKSLRADGNRFRDTSLTETEKARCLKAFQNIKTLRLEENLLPWEQLATLTHLFPAVTTFDASSNQYMSLTSHFLNPTITDLTLEDNSFKSLSSLSPLTKLPNLKRLVLKSNKIFEINAPGEPVPIFPASLSEVDFSFNELSTWTFINALEHVFPGLTALRVSQNPLYHSLQAADGRALSPEDGYMLTLARLGNLKSLNFSPITAKERLNAESYYLSLIAREVTFAPEHLEEQILSSHPRYKWLCEEYGEPVIQRSANAVNPNSLAARLIRFSFYLSDAAKAKLSGSGAGFEEKFEMEIPMGFTAYSFLGIVGKRLGVKPMDCRLIWETGDWIPAPKTDEVVEADWDSDSEEEDAKEKSGAGMVLREVEILPGTRSVGTWIDGMEAVIRIELK